MSNPHDSADFHHEELQFDEAEFTEPAHAVATCTACQTPIADLYYEAGGKIVCDPCRHKVEAMFHGGSRLGRALKALILGTIAAAAGAALYYAIIKITGWNIGLVAVLIGVMIGGAVKAGSGNRGGWFYQLMALFLTYSAIAAMIVPVALEALHEQEKRQQEELQEIWKKVKAESKAGLKKSDKPEVIVPNSTGTKEVIDAIDQPKTREAKKVQAPGAAPKASAADPIASKTINPTTKPATTKEAPEPARQAENIEDDDEDEPEIIGIKAPLNPAFLILLVCAAPILAAITAPISGLIFAFALWEAWKINRKVGLVINGPFHLAAGQSVDLTAKDFDHEG